jgi:predicted ATPase
VTFLFTDIEGSTRLLEDLGTEAYGAALEEHRRRLREAFAGHDGIEVDTQGDAFFVVFSSPRAAVAAAMQAQRALAGGRIRVRMGMHTGSADVVGGSYVGQDVHLGARIAAAGHGGQVLLSKQTAGLVGESLTDLGEHRLKDFVAPIWIYQLGTERFPPLRTISNTNLPRPASSFVGRNKEVADIGGLLKDGARLVTLTGPGGTGKTRLAIESAAELVPDFRNGVFWVDLSSLRDPALVSETIAQTVGAQGSLADHIGERQMLLVLDNLEQVVDAAPDLSALLNACPNLRLLDTSRELLRIGGEVEYAVPPLATPEAVALFAARSGLPSDESIAALCRRLDNLPLAVELAAARTSVLSPTQILERLAQRLDLLRGGRDADPRQQTLRTTIAWSHDLLTAGEQLLFARLSVFSGGCSLDSAEAVCDADVDVLQSLVDKSLVRHSDERFSMLETIREYAAERLDELPDREDVRQRYAAYFLELAEAAEPNLRGFSAEWLARLEREHDNLRAALDHFAATGESLMLQRLAGALSDLWMYGGHVEEGWRRISAALTADARPTAARARALMGATDAAQSLGDTASVKMLAGEALKIQRELGNTWAIAYVLGQLGLASIDEGNFATAKEQLAQAVEMYREVGDEPFLIAGMRALAYAHAAAGEVEIARALHEANLARARAAGAQETVVGTLGSLAMIAAGQGRVADTIDLARENLTSAIALGSAHSLSQSLARVADVCVRFLGKPQAAAQLLGCFEGLGEQIGVSETWVARNNEETLARIAAVLDAQSLAEARRRGQLMSIDEGATFALNQLKTAQ